MSKEIIFPTLELENQANCTVAGIDEAGRGPWAGPVVAACVILDKNNIPEKINDSKKLSKKKREELFTSIIKDHKYGIGIASVEDIDELNILGATKLAMKLAYEELISKLEENQRPKLLLIDGNQLPNIDCEKQAVIKGDSKSLSIASASILAKVTRDNIMNELHNKHPQYNWINNSGYGTKQHIDAIKRFGITIHHRKSFKPIALYSPAVNKINDNSLN